MSGSVDCSIKIWAFDTESLYNSDTEECLMTLEGLTSGVIDILILTLILFKLGLHCGCIERFQVYSILLK